MIVQITDWLYQGDWASVVEDEYQKHKIGAVINVVPEDNRKGVLYRLPKGVNYLWCPFDDQGKTLTQRQLEAIINFAWSFLPDGLLVHCQGGQNRSSIICVLLLCMRGWTSMPVEKACNLVLQKNPGVKGKVMKELVDKVAVLIGKDLSTLLSI